MKFLFVLVVLGGCVEEGGRPADSKTCGKCVEAWTTVPVEHEGQWMACTEYADTDLLCCPLRGDTGCPPEPRGVLWDFCDAEAGDPSSCMDDDALAPVGQVTAVCVSPAVGCGWAAED